MVGPSRTLLRAASSPIFDVVVVGGGMVGAALTSLLGAHPATSGLRIALLDQQVPKMGPQEVPLVPGLRVSTITPASARTIQQAGAWEEIAPPTSVLFSDMQVWDTSGPGAIRWRTSDGNGYVGDHGSSYDAAGSSSGSSSSSSSSSSYDSRTGDNPSPLGQHMGLVVENCLLQAALVNSALRQASNLETMWPASLQHLHLPGDRRKGLATAVPAFADHSSRRPASADQDFLRGQLVPGAAASTDLTCDASRSGGSVAGSSSSSSSSTVAGSSAGSGDGQYPDFSGHTTAHSSRGPGLGSSSSGSSSGGGNELAQLQLSDGRSLLARLVVAADGANSAVRGMAGIRTFGHNYHQRAVVATVVTAEPNFTAWQRFLPTGPLALLPVRDGYSNIVWSTTPAMAAQLERLSPAQFAQAVDTALQSSPEYFDSMRFGGSPFQQLLQPLLSALPPLPFGGGGGGGGGSGGDTFELPPRVLGWAGCPPRSFPLHAKSAGRYVQSRLALIGDAAHSVHPLAGQGVNLGFGDVQSLAAALVYARETGGDIGDVALLREYYEAPRQAANLTMTATLHSLQQVFSVNSAPFAMLRNAGLGLLNSSGPAKDRIMRFAMGM